MSYQREKLAALATEALSRRPLATAKELSGQLKVHRHTLQRALAASGASIASLRQSVIIEQLKTRFSAPSAAPLKEIRAELGFPSSSAFARYVRRATGKSPSQLRSEYALGHAGLKRDGVALELSKPAAG